MERLSLRYYGDPVLRKTGDTVEVFDDDLRNFAEAMVETMIRERGIGLAAPQVGESIRLIVALEMDDVDDDNARPVVLVNPRVVDKSKETWSWEEGSFVPRISVDNDGSLAFDHPDFRQFRLWFDSPREVLFCDNHTNASRVFIEVNEKTQTNVPHIYAVGDVNGRGAFTHTSVNDGEIFWDHFSRELGINTESP